MCLFISSKFPNKDKYLLHFNNLIKAHIGLEFTPFIKSEILNSGGKDVLVVDCKKCDENVFLKINGNEEYYIRTNASSEQLKGKKLIDYTKRRSIV